MKLGVIVKTENPTDVGGEASQHTKAKVDGDRIHRCNLQPTKASFNDADRFKHSYYGAVIIPLNTRSFDDAE